MIYILMWKGEEIDSTDNLKDAKYLKVEYNMAFNGGVTIKRSQNENNKDNGA